MIFDIWRFMVKILPFVLMGGITAYILGSVGDPKIIKNQKVWKKWGLIIIGICMTFVVLQMVITYSLLTNI